MKIAVITGWAHYKLGGIENYSALCYENWVSNHEVVEFPLLKTGLGDVEVRPKNLKVIVNYSLLGWKPYSLQWVKSYPKKIMTDIYNKFDVVIINNPFPPRKWLKHPKSVLVQHMHLKWYSLLGKDWRVSLGQFFSTALFGVGTFKNSFFKASNVVFFDKLSEAKTITNSINYIPIPYKMRDEIDLNYNQRNNFIFIGRLENQQKNIKSLVELANQNDDILIYGFGQGKKFIDKNLQQPQQFQGGLNKSDIDQILSNAKALIITSHFEGFPTVAVEALTNGTPIILFNSFETAPFFAESGAAFLIPKGNLKMFNEKIQWLRNLSKNEYQDISNKAVRFAQQHLNKENFWENWNKVLKNFITKT